MLPADCIQVRMAGGEAVPLWLGAEDHAWLSALIEDFARLDGRPYREVLSFLREPTRAPSHEGKRRMAVRALLDLCTRERPPFDSSELRDAVAVEAQRARDVERFVRSEAIAACAGRLGLSAASLDEHLFSDLPGERCMRSPNPAPDVHTLATRTNLALAQGLLRLASEVTVELEGGARAVIRQVHLRRLLCTCRRLDNGGVRLEISGPFSLFRHTTMYGRALASILPLLLWCERFKLVARCTLRGRDIAVRLGPGDPVARGEPPRAYDSRLEARFAREFARANLDWDLVREPEPVEAGDALVFPDFAVVHRRDPMRRLLLEIVGFWTPEYLSEKLARLRALPHIPLVLCIDRGLNCSAGELPAHARVVWYQRRIDPAAVLAAIEAVTPECPVRVERLGLADLFIDWAGRHSASAPLHRRLARLKAGDVVRFRREGASVLVDATDGPVALLSRPGRVRWLTRLNRIMSARVAGIVEREASQSAPQWRSGLRCERWAVPVVDVILADPAPIRSPDSQGIDSQERTSRPDESV